MLNLNENKLKKEIKNVSNDHNIKVLFRSENNDVWSKTVCSSELEEVFYTNEFLNYQISSQASNLGYVSLNILSFFILFVISIEPDKP